VEQYFIASNNLLLPYRNAYWLGLKATAPPRFQWVDPYASGPGDSWYSNWGYNLSSNVQEPATDASKLCGAGHWNLSQGAPVAYGWKAEACGAELPFICKMRGGGSSGHTPGLVHCICISL
jgi:hypothetical protein